MKYGNKLTCAYAYKEYKYKDKTSNNYVTSAQYRKILSTFSIKMMEVLLQGDKVDLPCRLGSFQIVKYKPKKSNNAINFNVFKKYGEKVPYSNMHSDGYRVSFKWDRFTKANFRNKSMWGFYLTKDRKCRVSPCISKHVKSKGVNNFIELMI